MNKVNQFSLIILGGLLAIGLSVAGYFIGQTLYNAKVGLNTAEAKGLAENRVKSDMASWNILFRIEGKTKYELPELYKKAESQQKIIKDILVKGGFDEEEIKSGVINYYPTEYRNHSQQIVDEKHLLNGTIHIETQKIDLIEKIRPKINRLIAQGFNIENQDPRYFFTKLNDIKPEMLKKATQNARIAASEFAKNADVTVGNIRSATQGRFIVRDAGMDYGDTNKIFKDVRVITTIVFYLSD